MQPTLGGDAATNPTCGLMTPGEVADFVAAGIKQINGSTGGGAYARTSSDCTWFLDSGEAGIPSVNVQWEYPVGHWHDPVIDLYKDVVKQGLAVEIPDLGDYAILGGHNAEAIEGRRIVRVSVIKNLNDADKAAAVALLKLLLPRTVDIPSASP